MPAEITGFHQPTRDDWAGVAAFSAGLVHVFQLDVQTHNIKRKLFNTLFLMWDFVEVTEVITYFSFERKISQSWFEEGVQLDFSETTPGCPV